MLASDPRRLLPLLVTALVTLALDAHAQAVRDSTWVTDGVVNAIASTGSTVFIGGTFTQVGPWLGSAADIDRVSSEVRKPYPRVTGSVFATVPDGAGGWFIGGSFTAVQGSPRSNLAHLLADGTVAAWNPGTDGAVRALDLASGLLYAGGDFLTVAGQVRHHVAVLDLDIGVPAALAPDISGPVFSLMVSGTTLYVSGSFARVNGHAAPSVAAFDLPAGTLSAIQPHGGRHGENIYALARDASRIYIGGTTSYIGPPTGSVSLLDPTSGAALGPYLDANGVVKRIVSDGAGGWYVGGGFTLIAGQARQNLAHVLADGSVTPWNPAPNDTVRALAVSGDTVYVGGSFTTCGGQTRPLLAAVDAVNGVALGWNPAPDGVVVALLLKDGKLYVGGNFVHIGGQQQQGIAAFDASTLSLAGVQPWSVIGLVNALAANTSSVFMGGTFTHLGPSIPNVVKTDAAGTALALQSGANGPVYCAIDDGAGGLFIGGDFTSMQGQPRTRLAHVLADGTLANWAPVMDGFARSLVLRGNTLYVGGSFLNVGGQPRRSLAAVDATTGVVLPFPAGTGTDDGYFVFSMVLAGDTLYVGGNFHTMSGQPRPGLAALDAVTGALASWNPNAIYSSSPSLTQIRGLTAAKGTIYVIGRFDSIQGQPRTNLAAIDPVTGSATGWLPAANALNEGCIAAVGDTIFIGGDFSQVNSQPRSRLAAIDRVSAGLLSWAPQANGAPVALSVRGGLLYAAGGFSTVAGQGRQGAAAFDLATGLLTPFAPALFGPSPGAGSGLTAMPYAGGVLVGGTFTVVGGLDRRNAAGFVAASGAALFFNPDFDNSVNALAVAGDTVYFGGPFTTSGGVSRNRAAAWDLNLGRLPWNPNANGKVNALAIVGSTVYLGGEFTSFNGGATQRRFAAAFDAVSGAVTPWNPSPNENVQALAAAGGQLIAGGGFSGIGGATHGTLAALDPATGASVPWAAVLSGEVHSILSSAGTVYAGGGRFFVGPSGISRAGLIAFTASTGGLLSLNAGLTQGSFAVSLVNAMVISNDTLYIGGEFDAGTLHHRFAALSATSGVALDVTFNADGTVYSLRKDGGRVFVGGAFGTGAMQPRRNFAALDAISGEPRPWSLQPNGAVASLAVDGGRLLVGGNFTLLGSSLQERFAVLDTATGASLTGDLVCGGTPLAIVPVGDKIYLGGGISDFGGVPRNNLLALDRTSFALTPWNPNVNNTVNALVVSDGLVYAGGFFTLVGGVPRRGLAAIDAATGLVTAWDPSPLGSPNTFVNALVVSGNTLYAGGNFNSIGGQARPRLAAVDRTSGAATSWNPAPNGNVNTLAFANGTLFAGGAFSSFAGPITRQGLAAFNTATGALLDWAPAANGTFTAAVNTLVLSGGTAYVGGTFTQLAGQARHGFAALADPSFNPLLDVTPHPERPPGLALAQNSPNPFHASSTIPFTLPRAGSVRLRLLDPAGRVVRTLIDGAVLEAGPHTFRLQGAGLAPGLYWCRLEWDGQVLARRIVAVP